MSWPGTAGSGCRSRTEPRGRLRRLKAGAVDLVIATPETALTLLGRSVLSMDGAHRPLPGLAGELGGRGQHHRR